MCVASVNNIREILQYALIAQSLRRVTYCRQVIRRHSTNSLNFHVELLLDSSAALDCLLMNVRTRNVCQSKGFEPRTSGENPGKVGHRGLPYFSKGWPFSSSSAELKAGGTRHRAAQLQPTSDTTLGLLTFDSTISMEQNGGTALSALSSLPPEIWRVVAEQVRIFSDINLTYQLLHRQTSQL